MAPAVEEETRAKVNALLEYLNATSTQSTVSGEKEHAPSPPAMVDTGPGPAPVATSFENRGEAFTAIGANAPAGGAGGQGGGGAEKKEEETEEEEELKTLVQLVLEDEIQMNWYPNGDRRRQTHQDPEANMKTRERVKAWLGPFTGRGCDDAVVAGKLSKYWQQRHSTLCDKRDAGSGNEEARLSYAEKIEHAKDILSTAIETWAREVELIAVPSTWLLRNMAYELGTPLNNPGRKEKVTERGGQVVLWVYSRILRGGVCEACVFQVMLFRCGSWWFLFC